MTISEIEEYIAIKTPYTTNKLKTEVLKPMELRGELIPITPRRTQRISYPNENFKVEIVGSKRLSEKYQTLLNL